MHVGITNSNQNHAEILQMIWIKATKEWKWTNCIYSTPNNYYMVFEIISNVSDIQFWMRTSVQPQKPSDVFKLSTHSSHRFVFLHFAFSAALLLSFALWLLLFSSQWLRSNYNFFLFQPYPTVYSGIALGWDMQNRTRQHTNTHTHKRLFSTWTILCYGIFYFAFLENVIDFGCTFCRYSFFYIGC